MTINIKLDENYRITSDRYQYKLIDDRRPKQVQGYCSSIESVLNLWVDKKIRDSDAQTLLDIKKLLNELTTHFAVVCGSLKLDISALKSLPKK